MAAIDDLNTAITALSAAVTDLNAKVDALLTKPAGTSDADIAAAVGNINNVTTAVTAEAAKLS